ncbi:Pilus assembly protein [Luteimonas sp. 9C]|uniref:pilus assembly protein n=1 Tax=Luteimonas sp. 9C TaxID=2653148 RepID=UPI0012F1F86D|nr:PilC/PilY family type IV pilus protein [Luteimonas sp. 9C]VXB45452.1 Pilus assembly protein [Luteimonas sp. 9C]
MKGRTKLYAGATALVLAGSAYFLHSVMAVQGQGTLAQQPLNVQAQIPPAFIMAVDDSGSMTFETLLPGQDGQGCWNPTGGFFNANGSPRTTAGTGGACGYNHLIPYTGHRIDGNRHAIAPILTFGFARSHEYNPSYFNPAETYLPWLNADGTPFGATATNPQGNASITATRANPRANSPVIDMTEDQENTDTALGFRLLNGMTLPFGTEYYATGACGNGAGAVGGTGATRNRWVTVGPLAGGSVTATCTVGIRYFPATFYLSTSAPAPAGYRATVLNTLLPGVFGGRQLASNACGPGCDMYRYEIRRENYTSTGAYNAAIQNFANWFSFYGNRNRAMIAGMTRSLSDVQNMRVGYFRINSRTNPVAMRNMNLPSEKSLLYTDLLALPASGGTPNLFAVDHIGRQFQRTGNGAPIQLACQKNAGMLFTDGYSNGGTPGANAVTGLGAPFDPTPSGSLAAIATQYYQTNLRPDFPTGRVPVPTGCSAANPDPRLDCNTNLHMNFYGVTLGATGSIYDPDVARDPFVAPFPNWPGHNNDNPTTVDDIWHATINTRGEYINARTPNDITAAMRRVLASVSAGSSPAGSIALTGARIGAGSLSVFPFYEARNNGTDWYSTLTAQSVTTNPNTGVVSFSNAWEASNRMPAVAARSVWYGTGTNAALFNPTNVNSLARLCDNPVPNMSLCSQATLAALGGAGSTLTLTEAINYLKGDQTLEAERNVNGTLRFRTTRLGDIVNATPVVSAPTDDYGYRALPAPYGASYATYMSSKVTTGNTNLRRPMVYAGANDGMLHGFDGRTTTAGGIERFAFIPQTVLGHMGNLLFPYDQAASGDQRFQHRYFVDGPLAVSDAYYGAGADAGWRTVLVGSTGAGAKGVFGLNVSGVSRTSGDFAAADRLWEVSALNTSLTQAQRENIGYVLGRPVIVPVKTGSATGPVKWHAIFGNGYNSTSGKAVLYMVEIGTGAPQIRMIEAVESGAPAGSNGLGNVVVLDRFTGAADNSLTASGRDGFADTAYAADQKGAVWKFDLRAATPVAPTRPLFTSLLYTSGAENNTRQPILGGLTAAAGRNGGVMLYFGTGSFSFDGDPVDVTQQSLYAVLDAGTGQPTTTITRTNLSAQTITSTSDGVRSTSSNIPAAGRLGWYIDLPVRERFVGYPRIESGIVFMPTYAPVSALQCSVEGANWLYGLNALTGAAGLSNVTYDSPQGESPGAGTGAISLNTQGTAPVKDVAIFSSPRISPLAAGATPDDLDDALEAQCSMVIQVAGAPPLYLKRPCGRQSWRQIQ